MNLKYLDRSQRNVVREWWRALQPREEDVEPILGMFTMLGRADRARLRHCKTPCDALLEAGCQRLTYHLMQLEAKKEFAFFSDDTDGPRAYALVAGVLSHLDSDTEDNQSFAAVLGKPREGGEKSRMSELRFQRLQKSENEETFFRQAIRAVKLSADKGGGSGKSKADVVYLANDLLAWVWEYRAQRRDIRPQDRLKIRWANEYYRTALNLSAVP